MGAAVCSYRVTHAAAGVRVFRAAPKTAGDCAPTTGICLLVELSAPSPRRFAAATSLAAVACAAPSAHPSHPAPHLARPPAQFGLLMGWYYTFSCFKFSKDAAQDALTAIVLSTVMLYWVVGAIHWGAALGPEAARTLWCATQGGGEQGKGSEAEGRVCTRM